MNCFFNPCVTIQITRRVNRTRNSVIHLRDLYSFRNRTHQFKTHIRNPWIRTRQWRPNLISNLTIFVIKLKKLSHMEKRHLNFWRIFVSTRINFKRSSQIYYSFKPRYVSKFLEGNSLSKEFITFFIAKLHYVKIESVIWAIRSDKKV